MNTRKLIIVLFFILCLPVSGTRSFAATTAQQQVSGQERTRQMQEEDEKLRRKIEEKKEIPKIEQEAPAQRPAPASNEKVLIINITVSGATLVSQKELDSVTKGFENKELTLADMQKIADMISDLYRQKGYITSRAYLPPQKIENGILGIIVMEGTMGDVDIKGNRYFSRELYLSYITLHKGDPFNYNTLRDNLTVINQSPDRTARAVLIPGKEQKQADMLLEVKDRLPLHAAFDWDNYGSRYINKQRYSATVSHNNVLGLDDSLSLQYQITQAGMFALQNLRYILPLNPASQLGFFAAHSHAELGKEFEDSGVIGDSKLYGVFLSDNLYTNDNVSMTVNCGFDYKDNKNYLFENIVSYDRLRIAKIGLDTDLTDSTGRTLITDEFDFGIPNIMGGLQERDAKASRTGSGGQFNKNTINLLRLQRMPFSSVMLFKGQAQISPYVLTSTEEFQMGGIANVRGYPPAEAVGDSGYSATLEATIPPYIIPQKTRVPFIRRPLYEVFRVAAFYDWANTHLKEPLSTEERNKTLRDYGVGMRMQLAEDFSFKVDFAWPLDNKPSDGHREHTWFQFSKGF